MSSDADHADRAVLSAVLDEFVSDLWADDRGLWELTWAAAGRTGQTAATFTEWARCCVADLVASNRVRLSVTSWPAMTPERDLGKDDWDRLGNEAAAWHDPEKAALTVLVQPLGAPPDWAGDRADGV